MKLKKFVAMLVVAMMVLASVSALAETTPSADSATTTAQLETDTLKLNKVVVVANDLTGLKVAHPAFDFTFTLAPATIAAADDVYVEDSAHNKVAVQNGTSTGAVFTNTTEFTASTGALTIPAGSLIMNSNGQEAAIGQVGISITAANFPAPGVYRYVLTDTTTDASLLTDGIVRGTGYQSRFNLDIYIGYATYTTTEGGHTAGEVIREGSGYPKLVINGYVLVNSTPGSEGSVTETKTPVTTSTNKESGIEDVTITTVTAGEEGKSTYGKLTGDAAVVTSNDFYYTYNVSLTKSVTGAMGDTAHEFPFALAITNAVGGSTPAWTVSEATTAADIATAELLTSGTSASLKNADVAHIYGLGPYATVKYTETNDTDSTYKVNATDATTALTLRVGDNNSDSQQSLAASATAIAYNSPAAITDQTTSGNSGAHYTAKANLQDSSAVTFINNLESISPTGVVLRFAPYFAMFAAGAALFIILVAKRRKNEEEEA